MRSEALYLQDIVEAADAVERFLTGVEETAFLGSEMLQSAVLLKLILIGEAAPHLSKEFRERHAELEWADILAFRNLSVHAYFGVQWPIVWVSATARIRWALVEICDPWDAGTSILTEVARTSRHRGEGWRQLTTACSSLRMTLVKGADHGIHGRGS
ncbi:MAG: hypothetical protein AUJ96_20145 [Armatimonadetes bacterium CG2_30_66_41]|nr:DUF86 domain-containing protein [Armatimonadota bacterium]OIO99037.1 MAG: hypothetical protein AUJ96_20145 [Armatimonadetes bacterium CG2_30_66_41]PIU91216.1 MAG: hypothetical protein COS65_22710 [Armatimonadetes bacterium CG06_land_8_20_14_3_00_66_21]PIX43957.1 MAG: hypothetical protein COZ57_18265 [Armatimonadetes bacterium CG_4_8_14_3_um_filter_66_20]PJB75232.1 MAG: hypothetical protein CO096_02315 [Armatimonadetes bacterium CG_4_9_14_3_um_filter_66_14]